MLVLGQKDEVLEVVRIFQQTADLNGDLVMDLPNHVIGSRIKRTKSAIWPICFPVNPAFSKSVR